MARYEVEQKYRVADARALLTRLDALGVELGLAELQIDAYYAHPVRDFSRTDEALRIRRMGDLNWVTYKGPKIDATTKTRREIELALEPGDQAARQFGELLDALSFRSVAEVRKHRRHGQLQWSDWPVEVVLDEVERVGLFIELEIVAEADQLDSARAALADLAARLDLGQSERRSYLEMLLLA